MTLEAIARGYAAASGPDGVRLARYYLEVAPLIDALRAIDAEQLGVPEGDDDEAIRVYVRQAAEHAKRWSKALEAIMLADRDARSDA